MSDFMLALPDISVRWTRSGFELHQALDLQMREFSPSGSAIGYRIWMLLLGLGRFCPTADKNL
jgi:hypothetical protein